MNFRFDVVIEQLPKFTVGLWNTVWLCVIGTAISLVLGLLLMLPLVSRKRYLHLPAQILVDAARAIPFLMLAYLVYYGLPLFGITLNSWTTAILTLVVYNTGYTSEIFRSAWVNLPPGQVEAGRAYGFSGLHLARRIIIPQVLLTSGPLLGNQFIQVIKDSAFLAVITIPELTYAARSVQSTYFVPFESFIVAALLYWALCLVVEFGVKKVEYLRRAYAEY